MSSTAFGFRICSAAFAMSLGLAVGANPGMAVADAPDAGSASQPSKPSVGASRRAAHEPSGDKAGAPRKPARTSSSSRPNLANRPEVHLAAPARSAPVEAAASVPKAVVAPARQVAAAALRPADIVAGFLSLFGLKGLPPSPGQLLTGMLAVIRREIEALLHPPAAPPRVSITDTTLVEGNSGTTDAGFTVTLSKASTTTVTVSYTTSDGSATAGQDYQANSGTVTFAPGVVSQVIKVSVLGDTAVEPTEKFTVTLSNPVGATIANVSAVGTITNDDTASTPGGTAQWGKNFFAPYIDMGAYPVPNLLALSKTYGTSLVTLGFMQSDANGNLAWAGLAALEPNSTNEQAIAINKSIATFKAAGGDVMISFGGAAGTSIAQDYAANGRTAQELANAYAAVVDTYGVTHLDFDIEGAAVADAASIALNSQALALLQKAKPEVQVWYTLPVLPTGLTADGLNVVDSALKAGVKLAGVNVMAMDYGESAAPTSGPTAKTMGAYAIESAQSTYTQLSTLYAARGLSFGWSQIGVTPMLGVNDVITEVFTVADAQALEDFARTNGIGMLSMWQVLRDTPGTLGQSTTSASGLSDPVGAFSKVFNDYGTINVLNYDTSTGGSGGGGGSTPVTGGTTTTVGWAWGANPVLTFDPAKDTLDFVWMRASEFEVSDKSGSTVITIVGNNSSYTLAGVTLSQLQMGNIIAKDAGTLAKWQSLIDGAKAV